MSAGTNRELVDMFLEFLEKYHEEDIARLAQEYPSESTSLYVDWSDLYRFDPDLADDYRRHPTESQEYAEEALRLYDLPVPVDFERATVRVTNLSGEATYHVGQTRARNRDDYLAIRGQVAKRTDVKPKARSLAFVCSRCGMVTDIPQSGTTRQEPHECQGCERQGPFTIDFDESDLVDHQLLRLTEPPERTQGGSGSNIDVVLEEDLVESAEAGDRVTVTGTFKLDPESDDDDLTFDTYVEGGDVTVEETDFDEIDTEEYEEEIQAIANGEYGEPIEVFVDSLAPKIWGYDDIKEALILQLFDGSPVEYPDGSRDRGDMHILLLGDPGCGKSKLLRSVSEIAPRSTYASGKGMSQAGMTAAAVRDDFGDTEWGLEAGALVLSDKGVACVDEVDKAHEDALSSLHQALESQQVEINKAGINTSLPARTSLLAAGNPKYGRFDHYEAIAEQIDLDPPLLSRFDLMFMLKDVPEEQEDADLAEHIVDTRGKANAYTYSEGDVDEDISSIKPAIPADVLRAYVAYAKQHVHPAVTGEQVDDLKNWYVELRQSSSEEDGPVPVTARKVEAMCRLAEASAKLRLSETVDEQDMERAGRMVMKAMRDVGVDPETGKLDADVIESGMSKSQRDRIKNLIALIDDLESEYNKGVPKPELIDKALDYDFDREMVEKEIENLKHQGDVYEPREGHLRTS